ncbi:MAG: chorismate mutase [Legionellales bacterium RIFCSPHIGHO2_12_FULL_37_14]|nr:MAG: chorismate mutase [Legionellales bacterium RIFCSPHIGHO2_12_FULL_37_14]
MLKLGVSGDKGSFSEASALAYMHKNQLNAQILYLMDMQGVLLALAEKSIDFGFFPVVNINGGLVKEAFLAMGQYSFTFVDDFWFDVEQCLLGFAGLKTHQIKKIVSHPQGLAQCKHYLAKHFPHIPTIAWQDTAKAAKDLAKGVLSKDSAVIAGDNAAKLYGLTVLAKAIQDKTPNLTAFILVKDKEHAA